MPTSFCYAADFLLELSDLGAVLLEDSVDFSDLVELFSVSPDPLLSELDESFLLESFLLSLELSSLELSELELLSDFFLSEGLLSLIYQPEPLKWMAGTAILRSTSSLSHEGHAGIDESENERIFSNSYSQLLHIYS